MVDTLSPNPSEYLLQTVPDDLPREDLFKTLIPEQLQQVLPYLASEAVYLPQGKMGVFASINMAEVLLKEADIATFFSKLKLAITCVQEKMHKPLDLFLDFSKSSGMVVDQGLVKLLGNLALFGKSLNISKVYVNLPQDVVGVSVKTLTYYGIGVTKGSKSFFRDTFFEELSTAEA